MNKSGFTVIEIIVSIALTSILMTAAFTIYNQISKSAEILEEITTYDTKAMVLQSRLQKDFTGITPLWFKKADYEKMQSLSTDPAQQNSQNKFNENIVENNFFYAENEENGQLNFFTFITVNGMQSFGSANQRFVRVVYLLEKDAVKNTFNLLRKEIKSISSEIEPQEITKSGSFYKLATDIKSFKIEYGFIDQPKSKQNQTKNNERAQQKWLNDWGVVHEKTKTNEYKPGLPETIKITLSFTNNLNKEYEYILHILNSINPANELISPAQKRHKLEQKNKKGKSKQNKSNNQINERENKNAAR